jgi:hypothetical protein
MKFKILMQLAICGVFVVLGAHCRPFVKVRADPYIGLINRFDPEHHLASINYYSGIDYDNTWREFERHGYRNK